MLVLQVPRDGYVMIGDSICVSLIDVKPRREGHKAKCVIGVQAPPDVPVVRAELKERKIA